MQLIDRLATNIIQTFFILNFLLIFVILRIHVELHTLFLIYPNKQ
ncbi:hypothetical protein B4147_5168 [Bacillus wiedmannii]|uniref:Uncharacterized protein n=1 Tax=Bacillus wiedmannii TaxID=1890302 RepID=A0A0G8C828_9BACI|nr:hypothetical protein B4147_5168 [Bacillus wiedmannii]